MNVPLPDGFDVWPVVDELRDISGVVAVTLGGSWASGRQRPDSDVDLGLYYRADASLDVDAVRQIARQLNDTPDPVVTDIGIWGQWVNGGSWLTIGGQRVDFLYRDLDFVTSTIDDVLTASGRSRSDFWQQAPYGFHPQIYCAEARCAVPLWDPDGFIAVLKQKVAVYPEVMKRKAVSGWLWGARFNLANVKQTADRGEAYLVLGHLTRAATEMIQALYALNETYFMNDKYVYRDIVEFEIAPANFMARIDALMCGDNSPADLWRRIDEARALHRPSRARPSSRYTGGHEPGRLAHSLRVSPERRRTWPTTRPSSTSSSSGTQTAATRMLLTARRRR